MAVNHEEKVEMEVFDLELFEEVEEIVTASWTGCVSCCS